MTLPRFVPLPPSKEAACYLILTFLSLCIQEELLTLRLVPAAMPWAAIGASKRGNRLGGQLTSIFASRNVLSRVRRKGKLLWLHWYVLFLPFPAVGGVLPLQALRTNSPADGDRLQVSSQTLSAVLSRSVETVRELCKYPSLLQILVCSS